MRRCSPRLWRVLSLPWLVSANLHAAAVLLLMCGLAPPAASTKTGLEISLGEAAPPTELEAIVELTAPPLPAIASPRVAAASAVRELKVELADELRDAADDAPAPALALPAVETLLTRATKPWDAQTGLIGAGSFPGASGAASGEGADFFGTTAVGTRFVFILDMSGSMKEGGDGTIAGCRFRRATDELLASVERLTSDQAFYIYLFSTTTRPLFDEPPLLPVWRPATPNAKSLLKAWLATIEPGGGTDPRLALQMATALRPDALFLLSDGRFSGREQKLVHGAERTSRASERTANPATSEIAPIHTFAFEDSLACNSMQNLALATGGVYRFVPPIFRRGKRGAEPTISEDVYAENLLKTAESLQRAGREDEALEIYRILARDFPETPAAEESAGRFAALEEASGES